MKMCKLCNMFSLKSSYDDVTTTVDDVFEQWIPSTATPTEETCGLQKETMFKNKPHLVTFHETILVSQ